MNTHAVNIQTKQKAESLISLLKASLLKGENAEDFVNKINCALKEYYFKGLKDSNRARRGEISHD